MRRRCYAALALAALLAPSLCAADPPALEPSLLPALEAALAAPEPREHAAALWDAAILAQGDPEPLVAACRARMRERIETILLDSTEEDPSLETPEILALRRLTVRLLRMLGDLALAKEIIEKIPESAETVADNLERAQILDALGENEAAHAAFGRLLEREIDEEMRSDVLLRRALLLDPERERAAVAAESGFVAALPLVAAVPIAPAGGASVPSTPAIPAAGALVRVRGTPAAPGALGGAVAAGAPASAEEKPKTPLALFAGEPGREPALANRAAVILALRGEQKDAIAVYTPPGGAGSERFREEVRLAEWALEAEQWDRAQEFAHAAVRSAAMRRDRRYALTILVEAYRRDGALDELIDRFAAAPADLTDEERQAWIDLLRETGRVEEALALFRSAAGDAFTIEMRRELLEMCRESGEEATLVEAYRELIAAEPRFIEWREGLSRAFLERGDRDSALAVWRDYLSATDDRRYRMAAASTLMSIGLDELAGEFARACAAEGPEARNASLLFLFELHHARTRIDEARSALRELDGAAAPDDPVRKDLADALARLGDQERAAEVLAGLRAAKGAESGTDSDMKLALILSEIGKEEEALALWQQIWREVESIPQRRYAEERLMAVASRLGKLAAIAVALERKIAAGSADDRDVGLLVRLYTHVKDAVSATEIVEEHWKGAGRSPSEVLQEKARIFVSCDDFYNYEKVVEELIEIDPDGRADYLQQLALAKLEGGRRDEARAILERLRGEESTSASLEFEAGVLALAGLREDALAAYRRSLAEHPERIDTYLLLSNLEKELGRHTRSAGMFQYLAETADRDDLFTIAIDGILNMRDGRGNPGAPDRLVEWARRIVLERISRRSDKLYLYRLLADLSEELQDGPGAIRALKTALPISGEQRTPILRELMALARPEGARRPVFFAGGSMPIDEDGPDNTEQRMFGRRLLGQGELVPPQVYLELGEAFLGAREVVNATKTFQRMSQLPEYGEFQRPIAEAFEKARYPREALRVYEQVLTVQPSDVGLLTKVGELHEQLGRDDLASELYRRGLELVLARRPARKVVEKEGEEPRAISWMGQNVDEAEQYYGRLLAGVIATLAPEQAEPLLAAHLAAIDAELAEVVGDQPAADLTLEALPRFAGRLHAVRRLALAFGRPELGETLDRRLLAAFPGDDKLLGELVRSRVSWGYVRAARRLLDESGRPEKERRPLALLVGGAGAAELPGVVPVSEASARILPLLVEGQDAQVGELLARLDLSTGEASDQARMPMLVATALFLGDAERVLTLCRHWLNLMIQHEPGALYGGVDTILRLGGMILDETQRRSLVEQLVAAVNESPDKFSNFVSQLPDLGKSIGGDLFTAEQVETLIAKRLEASDQFIYGIPEMFALLPAADRGPVARRIWPKIPKSQGAMFALQLLPVLDEAVDAAFADFLAASFGEGLEQADDPSMFTYYVDQLTEGKSANEAVALRFVTALRKKDPQDPGYRAGEALLRKRSGDAALAWELAAELFRERLRSLGGPTQDYRVRHALTRVIGEFYDERSAAFLELIDEAERQGGEDVELTRLRLELLAQGEDPERRRAAVLAAVARYPEEIGFLQQLQQLHAMRGESFAAIEVQARILAVKPEDERARADLVRRWRGLRNPVEALAALDAGKKAVPPEAAAAKKERTPPPSVERVKEAIEQDPAEARATFRRIWRNFPAAGQDPRFAMMVVYTSSGVLRYGGGRYGRQLWPPDPPSEEERRKEREEARQKRLRGGLPDLSPPEQPEEPEEVRTAQDVFVERGLEDEVRCQLRALESHELGGEVAGDIFRALARREGERVGVGAALEDLLERERRGEIGKQEYGRIFALLEMAAELSPEELAATLSGLLENVSPTDTGQIRRLARLAARSGLPARAGILYRWCAVVDPDRSVSYWNSAGDLLGEVIENLEGEERVRAVEAVLALSDPGDDGWWGRENYDRLVIDTWVKLLGPARALEKARPACERATELEPMPKRRAASAAAALYAVAGEVERALACLEVALCELEVPENLEYPWYRSYFEQAGWIGIEEERQIFPADAALLGGAEPARAWYGALAEKIAEWHAAERLREGVGLQLQALAALRLHELGDAERARALLDRIAPLAGDDASQLLWIADLARAIGDEAWSDAIERTLVDQGRLNLGRLPEVIARVRAEDGAELALALGEPAAAYTLDGALLDELASAAEAAEDAPRATHWRERRAAAEAAEAELERRDRAGK